MTTRELHQPALGYITARQKQRHRASPSAASHEARYKILPKRSAFIGDPVSIQGVCCGGDTSLGRHVMTANLGVEKWNILSGRLTSIDRGLAQPHLQHQEHAYASRPQPVHVHHCCTERSGKLSLNLLLKSIPLARNSTTFSSIHPLRELSDHPTTS